MDALQDSIEETQQVVFAEFALFLESILVLEEFDDHVLTDVEIKLCLKQQFDKA